MSRSRPLDNEAGCASLARRPSGFAVVRTAVPGRGATDVAPVALVSLPGRHLSKRCRFDEAARWPHAMRGMDVMQFRLIALLVGLLPSPVGAPARLPPGMKDRVLIPAPIPDYGAIAVPGGVPVPEGFTYYLRADLGWGFCRQPVVQRERCRLRCRRSSPFAGHRAVRVRRLRFVAAMTPRATVCSSAPSAMAPTSRRASAAT